MAEERNPHLEDILEECLEAVRGGEGIEACLARYPQFTQELRPLLESALRVELTFSTVEPHPYFRTRTRYRLLSSPQKRPLPLWRRPWALALSPLLLILFLMGGTALAAGNSLPDQPLYPVKLATERAQLALTTSSEGKAQLQLKLVESRITEMNRMAQRNKPQKVEQAGKQMVAQLRQVQRLSPGLKGQAKENLKAMLKERTPRHRQMLKQMEKMMSQPKSPMMPMPLPMPRMGVAEAEEMGDWEKRYQGFLEEIERALSY